MKHEVVLKIRPGLKIRSVVLKKRPRGPLGKLEERRVVALGVDEPSGGVEGQRQTCAPAALHSTSCCVAR
eukprot:11800-Alexandrium_andersonii.AAC.1